MDNIEITTRTHSATPIRKSTPFLPKGTPIVVPIPILEPDEYFSSQEFEFFTNFLRKVENRSFLMCDFEWPQEVNLSIVLKEGAGFNNSTAWWKGNLQQHGVLINFDIVKITSSQINSFLINKIGIPLSKEHASELISSGWTYVEEYDAYYNYLDLNEERFTITNGYRTTNDLLVIEYNLESDGSKILLLAEINGEYLFILNMSKE